MLDTNINFVDKSLQVLLQASKDYPNSNVDISVAYISAVGVSLLQPLLNTTGRKRVVIGLTPINRLNAFLRLQDLDVEVYVYVAAYRRIFHPKIYYGATKAQSWAMVGSSNLTQNGLSSSVERNLFITGQRHTEPFASIETQLDTFRTQAYPFDTNIEEVLNRIEKFDGRYSEDKYLQELVNAGIKPRTTIASTIPIEVQQVALDALIELLKEARLEYSYQMLLLLVMLSRADNNGIFSLEETASCFSRFYGIRKNAGLPIEKVHGSKHAEVERYWDNVKRLKRIIEINPFPRFERRGLLDLSEDTEFFIINPALFTIMTPSLKLSLRSDAIDKLTLHYAEDRQSIETMLTEAIG